MIEANSTFSGRTFKILIQHLNIFYSRSFEGNDPGVNLKSGHSNGVSPEVERSMSGNEIVESLKQKEDIVDDFLDNILSFKSNIIPLMSNSTKPSIIKDVLFCNHSQKFIQSVRVTLIEYDFKKKFGPQPVVLT